MLVHLQDEVVVPAIRRPAGSCAPRPAELEGAVHRALGANQDARIGVADPVNEGLLQARHSDSSSTASNHVAPVWLALEDHLHRFWAVIEGARKGLTAPRGNQGRVVGAAGEQQEQQCVAHRFPLVGAA